MRLREGEPNLSEVERRRSQGVATLHYADGDYRCRWFTPTWFTDDEDKWWDVDADQVVAEYVPAFLRALTEQRQEPGEPRHSLYEVYWGANLVWSQQVDDYEPVPLPSEGGVT
jgi:hypothetical protein